MIFYGDRASRCRALSLHLRSPSCRSRDCEGVVRKWIGNLVSADQELDCGKMCRATHALVLALLTVSSVADSTFLDARDPTKRHRGKTPAGELSFKFDNEDRTLRCDCWIKTDSRLSFGRLKETSFESRVSLDWRGDKDETDDCYDCLCTRDAVGEESEGAL